MAMDITNLQRQVNMDVSAFPRLFHLPIFFVYKLFGLPKLGVAYLMYFTMFLSLLFGMVVLKKLGGHSIGLFCLPIMISYGSYANVIGVAVLLFYLLSPSLLVFLILGFGYPFLSPLLVPFMIIKRQYKTFIAGSLILSPYACLLISRNFNTMSNEFPSEPGIFAGVMPYYPAAPIWVVLAIYFLFLLPVIFRASQSLKNREYYTDLTMPLTAVAAALLITYLGFEPGLIYKYVNILPAFSTITIRRLIEDYKP